MIGLTFTEFSDVESQLSGALPIGADAELEFAAFVSRVGRDATRVEEASIPTQGAEPVAGVVLHPVADDVFVGPDVLPGLPGNGLEAPPLVSLAGGNGRLEANEIYVATKYPGRIKEIMFDEGDTVELDLTAWQVRNPRSGAMLTPAPIPERLLALMQGGGIYPQMEKEGLIAPRSPARS